MSHDRSITVGRDEAMLAATGEVVHVALAVTRMSDWTFVKVNDLFCRLFGWSREEVIGHTSAELGLWPEPGARERLLALLSRHGAVRGVEMRYRNRQGEEGTVNISAMLAELDGSTHLVGSFVDTTAQRELLEGLRAAQSRLGVALRASNLLVFHQDRALRYTWLANPALGVTEESVIGRTDEELLGAEAAAPLVAVKRRVLETGQAERRDVWVANNGQLACFDLVVEPERDAIGQVCGVVCAALDITPRMTAPRAAPGVAIDARAPVQTIAGMTTLVGHEPVTDRQARRLQRIEQVSRRLLPPDADDRPAVERLRAGHAGRLVLVAEHNPVLRELVASLLESAGLRVVQAGNGVEAYSFAVQLQPALVLLDVELPQRGAVAAARALQSTLPQPMPIVAMMSSLAPEAVARALDAELDDLLDKPVSADTLYRKVLAWLDVR